MNWIKKILIKKYLIPILQRYRLLKPLSDAVEEFYTESENIEKEYEKHVVGSRKKGLCQTKSDGSPHKEDPTDVMRTY